tara:strand:+ start:478 stop:975 length:498 start_codon:yes stop_codon:yes gene_type:complete
MIDLKSLRTYQLKHKEIRNICKLKNLHWKSSMLSQLNYFRSNIKTKDIHNLLFLNKKIIGYTALRKKQFIINKKKKNYLLFDTLILEKKHRGKKLSSLMMFFNNYIIKKNDNISFLLCNKNLIKFYKNFGWKIFSKKNDKFKTHSKTKTIMVFNNKKKEKHLNFE